MPAAVLHELRYGVGLHAAPDKERARVDNLERALPVLAFDAAAARRAGDLEADLERDGRRPRRVDVQIAAIVIGQGEPVVARDGGFTRVPGVDTLGY